jgi:two-component system, NtrC family, sensor histidine kinase HydH
MFRLSGSRTSALDQRLQAAFAVALAIIVFVITWFSIRQSRADSFQLLQAQGIAFTESLARASQNAISAESFYDRLMQERYRDLVATLVDLSQGGPMSSQSLASFALTHDLLSLYLFDSTGTLALGAVARGSYTPPPDFVVREVTELLKSPDANYTLLLADGDSPGETVHYYLEITSRLDAVVVLAVDGLYYSEAVRQTGIGYLAQDMAGQPGVEYIIYQSTDGIIFSSRKLGNLLSIESDPFLGRALESDSITTRVYDFQGKNVLELVRPFSSKDYPFGLFRVGLSLDGYYAVSRGFDRQMIVVSGTLFVLLLLVYLYANSRRRREELSRQYSDIKTVTDRIFEQMDTGVAVVDAGGIIRFANQAFARIFGAGLVEGHRWTDLLPGQESVPREMPSHADEREVELVVNGDRRTVLIARSRLADSGGGVSVVLVVYDITRLKEYERTSARKERLSEMGNLAAGVAHEIRNPLNTISIAAQRLASEFTPQENGEQYLSFTRQIRGETSRLNQIITRFLALTREQKQQRETIRIETFLNEVADLLRFESERLGIDVTFTCEPGLAVEASVDGLKQVFLNLFSNSKDALQGRSGIFAIEARHLGREVIITVTDDGPGISPSERERLFTPFHTTKDTGTGLGLATVRRIVSEWGGDIELDGSCASGARFLIRLPARDQSR